MVSALFGPDVQHFGWFFSGDVFGPDFNLLAFRDADNLFAAEDLSWLGPCGQRGVYDRTGGIVALVFGEPAMRMLPPRIRPLPPRLKPAYPSLPEEFRRVAYLPTIVDKKKWTGLTVAEWLRQ
ncbi:4-fold beta flower protein [Xanthomonas graminis]